MTSIHKLGLENYLNKTGKNHIVITGEKGMGKSTFINSLMQKNSQGVQTYAVWGNKATPDCIMMKIIDSHKEIICATPYNGRMKIVKSAFDYLANDYFKHVLLRKNNFVFIDEIGYIESGHKAYCDALLKLFDKKSIIAVVKKEDNFLYNAIMNRDDIEIIDLCEYEKDLIKKHKLGCVVQASGFSKRFGETNKLMADFNGKPLIEHTFINLPRHCFDEILIITRSEEIKALAEKHNLNCVFHNMPLHSDTVKIAIREMQNTDACMFCVADQPFCKMQTYEKLSSAFIKKPNNLIRLFYKDIPSSPVIFPKSLYKELSQLEGETGGTPVVKNNMDLLLKVQCEDELEIVDIDTLQTLQKYAK